MTRLPNSTPIISVLMSCYNASLWLNESIKSVLNQTFTNYELILINDGSTDDTLEIINKFAQHDRRIIIINKNNSGLADSLNIGISQARGEWIARLDADDLCMLNRLEVQLDFVRKYPDVVLLGTGFLEINAQGTVIKKHAYPTAHKKLVKNLVHSKRFFPHSSAFYKTKAVQQLGGYTHKLPRSEDTDLWLKLAEIGTVASIKSPLVKIRKHENQISHDDFGRRQIIDSYGARISYIIRSSGGTDPLNTNELIKIQNFLNWIDIQLIDNAFFVRQNNWLLIRKAYFAEPNRLYSILKFGWALVYSKYTRQVFWEHFFGSNLAKKLASSWLINNNNHD